MQTYSVQSPEIYEYRDTEPETYIQFLMRKNPTEFSIKALEEIQQKGCVS